MIRLKQRVSAAVAVATISAVLVGGGLTGCAGKGAGAVTAATASGGGTPAGASASAAASASTSAAQQRAFARLESQFHATLGVYAVDTGTGRSIAYQADTRFAFCSTMKAFAAGVLLQHDTDTQLRQTIHYTSSDLVDYSPVTSQHVATGMTLDDVMTAALEVSDNTAYNLLLRQLGGPAALQSALRGLGDPTTNVDRTEPTVQLRRPRRTRATTSTPRALAADLRAFALGDVLSSSRRAQLVGRLRPTPRARRTSAPRCPRAGRWGTRPATATMGRATTSP